MKRWLTPLTLAAVLASGCNNNKLEQEKDEAKESPEAEQAATSETPEMPKRPPRPGKPEVPAPADVAAAPADATATDSGLKFKVLEPPTGEDSPRSFDKVKMEFVIWSTEGEMFDRSKENEPSELMVHQLMPGWAELMQDMKVGEKRRAWLPAKLGFNNTPGFPKEGIALEAKLLSVERMPEPPPAPEHVAAPPADAKTTESGLASKVLSKGKGKVKPSERDRVKVHYTGWTTDGKMFDSSIVRDEPMAFSVGQVIPGWSEGVQMMVEGEKRRLWIPEKLAYRGAPGAPKGMLVFDVELLEIEEAPEPPKTPKNVKAPPKNAKKTESGLASLVLEKGKGEKHPGPTSQVEVHYSGWTTDGKMFDSSVTRGEPITFGLDRVIPGWTEGVQLMVEGEKRRFWIPEELAYKGRPGAPQGMLVFDVELLRILD